ncbi:MAG: 4,5-DOPA dioxygenase extradiol [Bdellovibrionales bacterium]|nr:4,5-DOPA dioxygenase extradiol [Bdellovibrionales bacterium]
MSHRQPVLFIGHGTPMNALADNSFTRRLNALGQELKRPRAIVCVSSHWMTEGIAVTGMEKPRTIHDFNSFPQPLFAVQYPAPGSPEVAALVQAVVKEADVRIDFDWGLDHGSWSILRHMYPAADVPVLQLSLDITKPAEFHFKVGQQLAALRDHDILLLATGNIVHNLRLIRWSSETPPFDWALEFDAWIKSQLEARKFSAILGDALSTPAGRLSVPTPDHFLPLHYVTGAALPDEKVRFEYEEIQNASISMLSFSFGR